MAPRKKPQSPLPIPIGNCEVLINANNFTCRSDHRNTLQISLSKTAKINISVREEVISKSSGDIYNAKPKEKGKDYMIVLINPKNADDSEKSYLQEVLNIYTRELPTMNYAANTGKQSMFLEKCVLNGKYCTLLLKSKSTEGYEEVVAAITYQIVPADTQYAEVPLAAVSSIYQHEVVVVYVFILYRYVAYIGPKRHSGFGHFLYMELRKRLQGVGICTVICWGDRESEGFWLKQVILDLELYLWKGTQLLLENLVVIEKVQGFQSIAEVDTKGRTRRLPIKADIRKALCFPGGSTLMISHLDKNPSTNFSDSLNFCFPLKPCGKSSVFSVNESVEPELDGECNKLPMSQNQISSTAKSCQPEQLVKDGFPREETRLAGFSQGWDLMHSFGDRTNLEKAQRSNMAITAAKIGADTDAIHCTCSAQCAKRRIWEASLPSLKSKKVKGSHHVDCQLDSTSGLVSEGDEALVISGSKSLVEVTPSYPLTSSCIKSSAKDEAVCTTSAGLISKELLSNGECFRIMLMNIAECSKKMQLTKVIENLGGVVTYDGSISSHVVTGKVRKTLNFCTALCSGAWIVSPSWLKQSFREGRFVDELPYILYDEDYVLKYRAELKTAVLRAKARPGGLFKGYNISMAAHVQPPVKTLSAIVKSAGGKVIARLDIANEMSKMIYIACEEDMEEALIAVKKGIWTFSSDWLMNCIMRQELDLEAPQFAESL
ncbi:hypothetical protein Pint_17789 [Pistacia integerrima]|uniref:Uncharacterized protein n=1 Tax=Pistacia integerrima TaxID=434235 RepID=A0ACC0YV57_9ROSI|nr:hypothetical protein Pint_17789 [Pistacia integerrima]